ncbi:MAG TPA: Gfo/Idh/MocA family oxidoreductase [Chloroflexia bacterium]|nr:Gfo/Idh/MocA family oxidoreductase [Chloroflexia bacterium]
MTAGTDNHQPLRLGLVGCGRVVEKYHLPALKRSRAWTLAAACDPSPERRRWVQSAAHGVPTFERPGEMFGIVLLDAVLVATPPTTHFAVSMQALEKGLHVLVEKPMSLSAEEAHLMLGTARQASKLLLVGFNRRFHSTYTQLRAKLGTPNMAGVSTVSSNFIFDAGAWGAHLGDEAAGGGVLDDVVCHQVDLLCWLLGRRAAKVRATDATIGSKGARLIEYELDFCDGLVARCAAGHGREYQEEISIGLDDKTVIARPGAPLSAGTAPGITRLWDSIGATTARLVSKASGRPSPTVESFGGQLKAFAAGIRAGAPHEHSADAWSGLYSVQVVEAARESIRSGGRWQQIASTMETDV